MQQCRNAAAHNLFIQHETEGHKGIPRHVSCTVQMRMLRGSQHKSGRLALSSRVMLSLST